MGGIRMRFDFQTRGAQGVDMYDKPLDLPILGNRSLAPPILANVGPYVALWNSFWGVRGSARGCLCMPLDSRQQSDFQNWVGRGVDFQNRGAQGVDTYDKPLNPSIFGSRPLAPPILANVGTPWNSLWGMRGSARGCLCMPLDSGQQSDFQNWVGRGVDFQNRGSQGVDMYDKPLDLPILGNRPLACCRDPL